MIGKSGTVITEESYHSFPLFLDFRKTQEFNDAYLEIYQYSFDSEIQRKTDEDVERFEQLAEQYADQESEKIFMVDCRSEEVIYIQSDYRD